MKNKRLLIIVFGLLSLLLIPLIAMQFTDEVHWDGLDFLVMGSLLLLLGMILEWILSSFTRTKNRVIFIVSAVLIFMLVWAELAVGIFGSPFAGN